MNNRRYIDKYSGKSKSTRHFRFMKQRRKVLGKVQECGRCSRYPSGYAWSDYVWFRDCRDRFCEGDNYYLFNDVPTDRAYPKRYFRTSASPYLKKIAHRTVRRHNNEYAGKSNVSNKEYDFWCELT